MTLGVVRGIAEVVVAPGTDVVFTSAMHLKAFHIGAGMAQCAEPMLDELRPMQWTRSVLTPLRTETVCTTPVKAITEAMTCIDG